MKPTPSGRGTIVRPTVNAAHGSTGRRGERVRPPSQRGGRSDAAFRWASEPGLHAWREALTQWAAQHGSTGGAVTAGNAVLDYLRDRPAVTRSPQMFCRRDYVNPSPLAAWLAQGGKHAKTVGAVHAFLEWLLNDRLSLLDDCGRPLRSAEHWNPVARPSGRTQRSESVRSALPSRLLRDLLALLTENDWAWAKQQTQDRSVMRDADGVEREVWCPVRASALAVMLLLPLRGFQVRMLESGEGDSETYRAGAWEPNRGPHAPQGARPVRRGFLRAFRDPVSGAVATGFFVNTNKTADRLPDEAEAGYEMPWQHQRAIEVVERLRDWQETFNPLARPLAWSDVHEPAVRLATKSRPGAAFFLFRDPVGARPNQPLTRGRLNALWRNLVAALEDRLAERQERLPSGEPIRLTARVKHSHGPSVPAQTVRQPLYDLHSLRVSLLTALAREGGVPLHILSKCIAGHASILMTLYYIKDMGEVSECLVEASAKIDAKSQESFARYLRSKDRASGGFVSNDEAGAAMLDSQPEAGWLFLNTGICPVGGAKCHEGGPVVPGSIGKHGPVPGGPRNCVRCRFHITGPAFLPGLVASFNTVSARTSRAASDQENAKANRTTIENERYDAEDAGTPFDEAQLARAHARVEAAEAALDQHLGTLQATHQLVERCKAVIPGSSGINLVLAGGLGDLQTALRLASRSELDDAVCRNATLHPTSEELDAAMRRGRDLDRLLVRQGQPPYFMLLSDLDALAAGNEMTQLMIRKFGRGSAFRWLSGEDSAREARVAAELQGLIEAVRMDDAHRIHALALPGPDEGREGS